MTTPDHVGYGACNGLCLSAADIGIPEAGGNTVAYEHPMCPEHGDVHPYRFRKTDNFGREMCECGGYRTDHPDELSETLLRQEIQRELGGGYIDNARELEHLLRSHLIEKALASDES